MRYLGGKSRLKKYLAPIIDAERTDGAWVWDAFCGGLAMTEALSVKGPVIASDANAALISLYRAIAAGWTPPEHVSKADWQAAKDLPDNDPRKGYIGFGCSFGGMYFSSYVQPEAVLEVKSGPATGHTFTRRYHAATFDVLKRQVPKASLISCTNFLDFPVQQLGLAAVYCDPPYAGTVQYAGVPAFDHAAFVRKVAEWSEVCPVYVSEYSYPEGVLVFERPAPKGCTMAKEAAVERMYKVDRTARTEAK
jgi:DNA adenine methylase